MLLGGVGGPASIANADDALRGGWGVQNQNDDVIIEYVFGRYAFIKFDVIIAWCCIHILKFILLFAHFICSLKFFYSAVKTINLSLSVYSK